VRYVLLPLLMTLAAPALAIDCSTDPAATTASGLVATAPGLEGSASTDSSRPALGAHGADLALDAVLLRQHAAACNKPQVVADTYVKQTEFDNTPYRYNMQSGKLNAEEFAAWMESRGIRIVSSTPADGTTAADAVPASGETAARAVSQ
jgi:hypothetical protein